MRDEEVLLSVVIPAYNEEERLPLTLQRVCGYLSTRSISFEVIVVDDGSNDRTAAIAEQFFKSQKGGTVLRNCQNEGKGFSVKRGVLQALGKYILFSDADLSTPIEEVDKLLQPISDGYCDIAIASRAHRGSNVAVSQAWYRKLMGKIFNAFVRLLVMRGISDTQCGFKCFKRTVAMAVFQRQHLTGFGFDVEVLYIAQKAAYVILEVPVIWINSPKSRVRLIKDSARMFFDLWQIRVNGLKGRYNQGPKESKSEQHSRVPI